MEEGLVAILEILTYKSIVLVIIIAIFIIRQEVPLLVSIFRGRYVYGFCVGVYTQIFTVGVGVSAGIAKSENEIETTLDAVETYVSVVNSLSGNSVAVSDGRNVLSGIKVLVCSVCCYPGNIAQLARGERGSQSRKKQQCHHCAGLE